MTVPNMHQSELPRHLNVQVAGVQEVQAWSAKLKAHTLGTINK